MGVSANYLGTIMAGGGEVPTISPEISWVNSKRPVCDGSFAQFVEGKGHCTSRKYQLGYASSPVVSIAGYVADQGLWVDVGGTSYRKVWFETSENIASADYVGKYLLFDDGSGNRIGLTPALEPGTGMYVCYLEYNMACSGGATLISGGDCYHEECSWEAHMFALISSSIGLLEVVRGVRDATTGSFTAVLYREYYRAAIKSVKLTSSYGQTLPYLLFECDVDQVRLANAAAY
jgi:hypothetical protein